MTSSTWADCGGANVDALKADTVDRFYNVGTGVRTTIKELAETLLEVTGSDVGITYEPEGGTFVKNRIGSAELAEEELGFAATVGLEEGLRLVHWRRGHLDELERRRERADATSV